MIECLKLSYSAGKKILVNNINMNIHPGEFVVIMGPNGAGKSTLLKMIAGSLLPKEGKVIFKKKPLADFSLEELAKQRAVLSQHYEISFPVTAREIVMMGRYPYFNSRPANNDETIVTACMEKMDVLDLGERNYQTLSGGEAQKIQMCRVMAQMGEMSGAEEKLLLLDEPVSHLDIKYQHQLLQEAKKLTQQKVAVIAVLHDINLALKYADRILFMKEGKLLYIVSKNEKINAGILKEVFDIDAFVSNLPDAKGYFVVYGGNKFP